MKKINELDPFLLTTENLYASRDKFYRESYNTEIRKELNYEVCIYFNMTNTSHRHVFDIYGREVVRYLALHGVLYNYSNSSSFYFPSVLVENDETRILLDTTRRMIVYCILSKNGKSITYSTKKITTQRNSLAELAPSNKPIDYDIFLSKETTIRFIKFFKKIMTKKYITERTNV